MAKHMKRTFKCINKFLIGSKLHVSLRLPFHSRCDGRLSAKPKEPNAIPGCRQLPTPSWPPPWLRSCQNLRRQRVANFAHIQTTNSSGMNANEGCCGCQQNGWRECTKERGGDPSLRWAMNMGLGSKEQGAGTWAKQLMAN